MSTFISTLGWGFAALLTVAAVVALWEQAYAHARRHRPLPPPEPRRAAHLDLDLDQLPAMADAPGGDQAKRQAALGGALGRMAKPPGTDGRHVGQAWIETEPMVAASLQVELPSESPVEPAPAPQRH